MHGELRIEGRLASASNATLRCEVTTTEGDVIRCVYKPVHGERPLWDFPEGTLAAREVAFFELDRMLGWSLVPLTVWRDEGPLGPGSCQLWIDAEACPVDIIPAGEEREGWAVVLEGEDSTGRHVKLVHASTHDIQRLTLLDAIANNADRKGGHVLIDDDGRIWGIDHGVTFNVDDKLRSVLWGWADQSVPDDLLDDLRRLVMLFDQGAESVSKWLAPEEFDALRRRVHDICGSGRFPSPSPDWPAIPWPIF